MSPRLAGVDANCKAKHFFVKLSIEAKPKRGAFYHLINKHLSKINAYLILKQRKKGMGKIYLLMIVIFLMLWSLPEPTARVATNPTPTGDIRSWIGILILLVVILLAMIISSLRSRKSL